MTRKLSYTYKEIRDALLELDRCQTIHQLEGFRIKYLGVKGLFRFCPCEELDREFFRKREAIRTGSTPVISWVR